MSSAYALTTIFKNINEKIFDKHKNFICIEDFTDLIYKALSDYRKSLKSQTMILSKEQIREQLKINLMNMIHHASIQESFVDELILLFDDYSTSKKAILNCKKEDIEDDVYDLFEEFDIDLCTRDLLLDEVLICAVKLFKQQELFAKPQQYLENIVSNLADSHLYDPNDSLRMALLKHFVVKCHYETKKLVEELRKSYNDENKVSKAKHGQYVLEHFKEEMFDQEAYQDLEVVKHAKSLAEGKFLRSGGVRKDIYLLAYAFEMSYYLPEEKNVQNRYHDIEKLLFDDFYGSEHMNNMDVLGAEAKPNEAGANFKNYLEVCYLYGLREHHRYTYEQINKLIDQCKKRYNALKDKQTNAKASLQLTKQYRTELDSKIMDASEEDFIQYIITHYDCSSATITSNQSQLGAYQVYKEMLEALMENRAYDEVSQLNDAAKQEIIEELKATQGSVSEVKEGKNIIASFTNQKRWRLFKELDLIVKNNDFVSENPFLNIEDVLVTSDLFEKNEMTIDRMSLFLLCMYYYLEMADNAHRVSFVEFKANFTTYLNMQMKKARYQEYDEKHFFDVVMLLALFREMYIYDDEDFDWTSQSSRDDKEAYIQTIVNALYKK